MNGIAKKKREKKNPPVSPGGKLCNRRQNNRIRYTRQFVYSKIRAPNNAPGRGISVGIRQTIDKTIGKRKINKKTKITIIKVYSLNARRRFLAPYIGWRKYTIIHNR